MRRSRGVAGEEGGKARGKEGGWAEPKRPELRGTCEAGSVTG